MWSKKSLLISVCVRTTDSYIRWIGYWIKKRNRFFYNFIFIASFSTHFCAFVFYYILPEKYYLIVCLTNTILLLLYMLNIAHLFWDVHVQKNEKITYKIWWKNGWIKYQFLVTLRCNHHKKVFVSLSNDISSILNHWIINAFDLLIDNTFHIL